MPSFCSIVRNEEYRVGCTGQTVWVWDKDDTVLAKFKDISYAYKAAISPKNDIFVVKSTSGKLAFYSLVDLSLIKKFKFSKIGHAQDDGFCFSSDGNSFLNIERQGDSFNSTITVYYTSDLSIASRVSFDENINVSQIQEKNGEYYVLGYLRNAEGVGNYFFVAKFRNNEITDMQEITQKEWWFYFWHINETMFGEHMGPVEENVKIHTLAELWEYCKLSR
jgi:hypothetical protein